MTHAFRTLALVLSTIALGAFAPSASAVWPDPFTGPWEATDLDGSRMVLAFAGADDVRAVLLADDRATGCGEPHAPAAAAGLGVVDADDPHVLHVVYHVVCAVGPTYLNSPAAFTYRPASDTLVDGWGLVWHRPA